jgi:signal transduction histidine kinase
MRDRPEIRKSKSKDMTTPEEQKRNGESSTTGESMESAHKLPGEGLPTLGTAPAPEATFQETEHLLVELLATIGHEFRTPLAVINGYTSTLMRQTLLLSLEEQREFLQMILQAGKRLQVLTDRLLEIAQLEAGAFRLEFSLVDVCSVVREAITLAQQYVPEPLRDRFRFHLQCRDEAGNQTEEVPAVTGDARCLRKVLDYLLENAIRFSPEGGRIDVIARPVAQGGSASVHDRAINAPSFLEICVCDFGLGIPGKHLERIFERFFRVDTRLTREVSGLGLGLTVCKYLVALHQGRIWAESCTAGGSAFHVWLPLGGPHAVNESA